MTRAHGSWGRLARVSAQNPKILIWTGCYSGHTWRSTLPKEIVLLDITELYYNSMLYACSGPLCLWIMARAFSATIDSATAFAVVAWVAGATSYDVAAALGVTPSADG